jgi:hypothetical protein
LLSYYLGPPPPPPTASKYRRASTRSAIQRRKTEREERGEPMSPVSADGIGEGGKDQNMTTKNKSGPLSLCPFTTIFFHPSLLLLFLDPGSEIRDPGAGIRDPVWVKIRIRDKHPGSATLTVS